MITNLYHISLVAHLIGLSLIAGATLTDYIVLKQFWKQFAARQIASFTVQNNLSSLSRIVRAGISLLVLSGIAMMACTKGVFGEQVWFRIKFALVLLVIANIIVLRRRQGIQLGKILSQENPEGGMDAASLKIKTSLLLFFRIQLSLFLLIIILSVFKFN